MPDGSWRQHLANLNRDVCRGDGGNPRALLVRQAAALTLHLHQLAPLVQGAAQREVGHAACGDKGRGRALATMAPAPPEGICAACGVMVRFVCWPLGLALCKPGRLWQRPWAPPTRKAGAAAGDGSAIHQFTKVGGGCPGGGECTDGGDGRVHGQLREPNCCRECGTAATGCACT